jgi:predicted DsbA family dithiol-disulfide isomerase
MAEERGMVLRLPPVQPRSRAAHEAAAFARVQGRFDALHVALFQAFFVDGHDLADHDVLVELAKAVGLDGDELRRALVQGRHRDEVLAYEAMARRLGLSGVPALVVHHADKPVERGLLVQGAQPFEVLQAAVARVEAG